MGVCPNFKMLTNLENKPALRPKYDAIIAITDPPVAEELNEIEKCLLSKGVSAANIKDLHLDIHHWRRIR